MRIFLAVNNELIREGLKKIFSERNSFEVINNYSDDKGLVDTIKKNFAELLILNIPFPNKKEIDLVADTHLQLPQLKILVLGSIPLERFALRVLKAGAMGFLTEQTSIEELITAVGKISNGNKYIESKLSEKISLRSVETGENTLHEKLSEREFEVMKMIASGKKISHIAYDLSLSINTVSTYRARLVEKLNIKSTADIVRYVLEHNLL